MGFGGDAGEILRLARLVMLWAGLGCGIGSFARANGLGNACEYGSYCRVYWKV